MADLLNAFVTCTELHVLDLILSKMSSALLSMISNSSAVKWPDDFGTVVRFRGRLERDSCGSRYSFGIAASRRLRAISATSL